MPNNFRLTAKTDLSPTGVEYLYTDSTGQGVKRLSLNNLATWLFGGTLSSYVSSAIAAAIAAFAPSGFWTPTLSFGGGSTGVTYSQQTGEYQVCGKVVFCGWTINLTSKGSSTGAAAIGGLPLVSWGAQVGGAVVGYDLNMVNLPGPILGVVSAGAKTLLLFSQAAANITALADTNFTNTSLLIGSCMYFTS